MTNLVRRSIIIGIGLLIVMASSIVVVRRTAVTEQQALVRMEGQRVSMRLLPALLLPASRQNGPPLGEDPFTCGGTIAPQVNAMRAYA